MKDEARAASAIEADCMIVDHDRERAMNCNMGIHQASESVQFTRINSENQTHVTPLKTVRDCCSLCRPRGQEHVHLVDK